LAQCERNDGERRGGSSPGRHLETTELLSVAQSLENQDVADHRAVKEVDEQIGSRLPASCSLITSTVPRDTASRCYILTVILQQMPLW
jgi:hypothetical protein